MTISYDMIHGAFLSKITEFEFLQLEEYNRMKIIDGFMKRAVSVFKKNCRYDLTLQDDIIRQFTDDFREEDVDELVEIISEGMVVQWLKPYVYQQENLQTVLNTNDYTTYSPAELLYRIGEAYRNASKEYTQMVREYSYNHADLRRLHT